METINKNHLQNLFLLFLYFVIRIPILLVVNANPNQTHRMYVFIYLLMYIIISILFYINRNNLGEFNIDKSSLVIFLLFGILFHGYVIDNIDTLFLDFLIRTTNIILLVHLWKSKIQLPSFSIFNRWNLIAVVAGFGLSCFVNVIYPNNYSLLFDGVYFSKPFSFFINNFVFQFGTVCLEEPIYRGFLWGTLRKFGYRDTKILLVQALLFWVSHLDFLSHPFTFWVVGPIISLLLGFLALKSKTIVPSTIAHSLYNIFI